MQYEIAQLRKSRGMSQNELAQKLQITQSFLSAIENGRSPLPPEKEERLTEIFGLEDLERFRKKSQGKESPRQLSESDLFNQLLQRFHEQAHSNESAHHHHDHHEEIEELHTKLESLFKRNERLMERNDSLAASNDRLREENDRLRTELDTLRNEIFRLKNPT